jgi:8-oxo-dGTP diphosphatase
MPASSGCGPAASACRIKRFCWCTTGKSRANTICGLHRGGVAFGETVQECLVREFKEETGLTVKPGRFLFLSEFLQPPLHALELFFEVHVLEGQLRKGSDPELDEENQLIGEVAFKSLAELRRDHAGELHPILEDLIDLDDLYMPQHRFKK